MQALFGEPHTLKYSTYCDPYYSCLYVSSLDQHLNYICSIDEQCLGLIESPLTPTPNPLYQVS